MKKILLLFVCLPWFLTACEKMEDTYKQFYEMGETIYVAKADSVKARGGNNRIELSWLLLSDPSVDNYKVYWNNRQDSLTGNVIKTKDVDTVRLMLADIPESVYLFEIILYDKNGHSSIISSVIGRSYGNVYQQSLTNRGIDQFRRLSTGAQLSWLKPAPDLLFTDIKYKNTAGDFTNVIVSRDDASALLSGIPVKGSFDYRSAYKPEPNALDTFYSTTRTFVLNL